MGEGRWQGNTPQGAQSDRLSTPERRDHNIQFIFTEEKQKYDEPQCREKTHPLARQRYFDLYILDNWLPDGTGVELRRLIREFDPHTPVVFLSAAAYESDVREALTAGAQIYLTKPTILDDLQWAVEALSRVLAVNSCA